MPREKPNVSGIPNVIPDAGDPPDYVYRYYTFERERIRAVKEGLELPPPYTEDPILHKFSFCNIFRTDDRVTRHYMKWIQPAFSARENYTLNDYNFGVVVNTIMYRLFNWPPTLTNFGLLDPKLRPNTQRFDKQTQRCLDIIDQMRARGEKTFTGAYIIPNDRQKVEKQHVVFQTIEQAYVHKKRIVEALDSKSLEQVWRTLQECTALCGPFIGYEIVTDLSYNILPDAKDKYTWANAGPGAKRGINRLRGADKRRGMKPDYACREMVNIMEWMKQMYQDFSEELSFYRDGTTINGLVEEVMRKNVGRVDMRTAEHTLCEYDKYMRVLHGEGRPRATYKPGKGDFPT